MYEFSRYKQLQSKARENLKSGFHLEDQLASAIYEIDMMEEHIVPKHRWDRVKDILESCNTHKAIGDEGTIRASINKMTYEQKMSLKMKIETL